MIYPITATPQRTIIQLGLLLDIASLAQSVMNTRVFPIYVNGNRLVHTREDCYVELHTITLYEVKILLLCCHTFININGSTHTNVPGWLVRQVYDYLLMNVQPIQCHPDYPTQPAWQPNLTQRQIDAIIAKQRKEREKAKAW